MPEATGSGCPGLAGLDPLVEREGRVSVPDVTIMTQRSGLCRQPIAGPSLDDYDTVGRDQLAEPQELKNRRVQVGIVRRIYVHDVELLSPANECLERCNCFLWDYARLAGDAAVFDVRFEMLECPSRMLDEHGLFRAARECLEPDRSGSGAHVKKGCAADP